MPPLLLDPTAAGAPLAGLSLPLRVAAAALRRPQRVAYGPSPSQVADLHVPPGPGPHPVAVLLHGGYWTDRFGRGVCRPLALDLVRRGWAAWNVEFRRLGSGGGWPATFADVAAGPTRSRGSTTRGSTSGAPRSSGTPPAGQLALWAASRPALPAGAVGAGPRVRPSRVVALAPVTALRRAGGHARALLGGEPDAVPERWAQADPLAARRSRCRCCSCTPRATDRAAGPVARVRRGRAGGRGRRRARRAGRGGAPRPDRPVAGVLAAAARWLSG